MKKLLAIQSLFIRLLAIFLASVALFFFIMSAGLSMIYQEWVHEFRNFDVFEHHLHFVIDDFGYPPDLEKAKQLTEQLPIALIIKDVNGKILLDSDNLDAEKVKIRNKINDHAIGIRKGQIRGLQITRNGYQYQLFGRQSFLNRHDTLVSFFTAGVMLFVLFVNYLLVRHLLRPIKLLKEGAERISQGELNYRVKHTHHDELGDLTHSINHMADSLNNMLEAKHQLLLAISHELRTPITRAKIQLELMPEDDARKSLQEDMNELDMLVTELLEAERLNSQHSALNREPTAIAELTQTVLEQYWKDRSSLLHWQEESDNTKDAVLPLDKLRYKLLVRNLVSNALKYGENKPVSVSISLTESEALLVVEDNGQGIAEEHLSHITEPFYRSDNARQRQTGGFGLGLYLCRLIAEAHNGELIIQSEPAHGTKVTVRLPTGDGAVDTGIDTNTEANIKTEPACTKLSVCWNLCN